MPVPNRFQPLAAAGVIAVIRAESSHQAVQVAGALLRGGLKAIELTFTTPGAAEALAEVRAVHGERVLLGAGTIREPRQVEAAIHAGAQFLVTAHLRPDLLTEMLASGLPVAPGVFTPSEVAQALDLGAEAVKLFPASTGGPRHLRALRGPFPELQVIPTGGIDSTDLKDWFAAGALAIGAGSELIPREALREGQWAELTRRAARFVDAARAARPGGTI